MPFLLLSGETNPSHSDETAYLLAIRSTLRNIFVCNLKVCSEEFPHRFLYFQDQLCLKDLSRGRSAQLDKLEMIY